MIKREHIKKQFDHNISISAENQHNFKYKWIEKLLIKFKLLTVNQNNVHIAWAEKKPEFPNSFNIMYAKSEDEGKTFNKSTKVYHK